MSEKIATRVAYGEALLEYGGVYQDIVVLDADLSSSTNTFKFAKAYPERFFNMGIAEQDMIATAGGFALAGQIPFASSFAMFATGRAWEQVRNTVAHNNLNVKICATHAGLTLGEDGASHQALEDVAIMSVIPHMVVLSPADAHETRAMVRAMIDYKGPVYLRLGRPPVPMVFDRDMEFVIGKSHIIRAGTDITIVAHGVMVSLVMEAVDILASQGIEVEVINLSSIKPLDKETILTSIAHTGAVLVAEEHNHICGVNQMISALIAREHDGYCPMEVVAVDDQFGQSGKPFELLDEYGLGVADIVNKAKIAISRKG